MAKIGEPVASKLVCHKDKVQNPILHNSGL